MFIYFLKNQAGFDASEVYICITRMTRVSFFGIFFMKSYNLWIGKPFMHFYATIGFIGILVAIVLNSMSFAFAANSYCTKLANSDPNTWCVGTDGDDRIGANGLKHNILGLGGNDQIDAGSGDDGVCGGSGNDRINGGDGKDEDIRGHNR